jgi:hypothetical protein
LSSPRARADVRAAIRDVPLTHRFPRRGKNKRSISLGSAPHSIRPALSAGTRLRPPIFGAWTLSGSNARSTGSGSSQVQRTCANRGPRARQTKNRGRLIRVTTERPSPSEPRRSKRRGNTECELPYAVFPKRLIVTLRFRVLITIDIPTNRVSSPAKMKPGGVNRPISLPCCHADRFLLPSSAED